MTSNVKIWESGQIIISPNVSKNYFSQVYRQKCGKNVINWVNFVELTLFLAFFHKIFGKIRGLGVKNEVYPVLEYVILCVLTVPKWSG